eukprot:SAG11_NODE_468_length_9209_cov_21.950604_1_plen_330_part_00
MMLAALKMVAYCAAAAQRRSSAPAREEAIPHNRQPGLVPPSGGWRGSTLGSASRVHASPQKFESVYGHQLHLWRSFKTPVSAAITPAEAAFVHAGGILWYNMQPQNWSETLMPAFGATIEAYAKAVKGLAPAQVIVNAGHEPNGHCDPNGMHEYFGSPAEYRAMWFHFRAVFSDSGVENAVWAMDYSRQLSKPQDFARAAELWPGDGTVDWLFFNAFGDHPMADRQGRGNWTAIVGAIYDSFERTARPGHNYTDVPWGLGAFQPKPPLKMNETDRNEYINQAATALITSRFPRLRGLVYYDHDASGMSTDYQPAYERYLSSPFFTTNDV